LDACDLLNRLKNINPKEKKDAVTDLHDAVTLMHKHTAYITKNTVKTPLKQIESKMRNYSKITGVGQHVKVKNQNLSSDFSSSSSEVSGPVPIVELLDQKEKLPAIKQRR
jgi:hypothetical protein